MKLTMLEVVPNPNDATSFYRGRGPIGALRRNFDMSIIPHHGINITWSTLKLIDFVFMQRPYSDMHLDLMKLCKENGKPVWVDYDDDLFCVPDDNPSIRYYGQEKIKKNIATIIAMADKVTVSTKHLENRLRGLNNDIRVIPNAFDDDLFTMSEQKFKTKTIAWRGSETHVRDLMTFEKEIAELIVNYKQSIWTFIGYNPWYIAERVKASGVKLEKEPYVYSQALDIIDYNKTLGRIRPYLLAVPLHNNEFNYSKSNIAWLEAVSCGGIALGPKFPDIGDRFQAWDVPGCINYTDPKDFYEKAEMVIKGEIDVEKENKKGVEYIKDNLLLSKVNGYRKQIIEELMSVKN